MNYFISKIRSIEAISLVGFLFLILNFFFLKSAVFGFLGLLIYSIPLCFGLDTKFKSQSKTESLLVGLILFFTEIILFGTIIYYFFKLTPLISFVILFAPFCTFFYIRKNSGYSTSKKILQWKDNIDIKNYFLSGSIVFADIFLLFYLFTHRTYDLSSSPWLRVTPLFFVLYTVTTILLFLEYKRKASLSKDIFLTSLHFFIGLSVAALIYPLGYGFDAFIHRATEEWIKHNGFILPKQPYYIGQYSLVTLLSHVTSIKIFLLDVFLVPLLAVILIPSTLFLTLQKWFNTAPLTQLQSFIPSLAFWLLPFVPFLSLHLTTPHNLVLLFTLILVFLSVQYAAGYIPFILPFVVGLTTLVTHPLIGAPNVIFILALFISKNLPDKRSWKISFATLHFVTLSLLLPILFTLNALRSGKPLPSFGNPFLLIQNFLELFARPYWYAKTSPIHFELLYIFERLIVPIILIFVVCGIYFYHKKRNSQPSVFPPIFLSTAAGLFISAFLLRSWIVFPDVVAYEQGDYPLRLIRTSLIFLLPFALYGFISFMQTIFSWRQTKKYENFFVNIFIIVLSVALTLTLYLSYPQRNIKIRFPGYNVTQSDFEAVQWIHTQNTQYNYIVLSNQLVSAAALTEYSFAKYFPTPKGEIFYYAIPTGGELYSYYGKMIYEGQKREYMDEAMSVVGVKKGYFIVNSYWANADKIIEGAKKTADSFHVIDEGKLWIFEYKK